MDESKRFAIKFLEKEVKTYRALALYLSKNDVKMHARVGAKKVVISPAFYKDRMKEAKKLVHELKKTN
jgi:mevalonate pyrophosphate decarboxylase